MGRLGLPFVVSLLVGCASTPPPPPYTPSFAYTPKRQGAGDGVSIALLKPAYGGALAEAVKRDRYEAPYTTALRDALGRSVLSYFNTNGFTVSGPFARAEDMTFPEKKQADLLLSVEIDVVPVTPRIVTQGGRYVSEGKCTASGSISLVLWEPVSGQRMWSKQIDVPREEVDCTVNSNAAVVQQTLLNNLSKLYERLFPGITRSAERYFHPDEVQLVKKQSQELREKKVF